MERENNNSSGLSVLERNPNEPVEEIVPVSPETEGKLEIKSLTSIIDSDTAFLKSMGILYEEGEEEELEVFTKNIGIAVEENRAVELTPLLAEKIELIPEKTAEFFIKTPEPEKIVEGLRGMDDTALLKYVKSIQDGDAGAVQSIFEYTQDGNTKKGPESTGESVGKNRMDRLREIVEPSRKDEIVEKEMSSLGSSNEENTRENKPHISQKYIETGEKKEGSEHVNFAGTEALMYYKEEDEPYASSQILLCRVGKEWKLFSGFSETDTGQFDPSKSITAAAEMYRGITPSCEKEIMNQKKDIERKNGDTFSTRTHYLLAQADTLGEDMHNIEYVDGGEHSQWFTIDEALRLPLIKEAQVVIGDAIRDFTQRDKKNYSDKVRV